MLRLLIDTSTWLDLAKKRDGRRLIVALDNFAVQGWVDVLVPQLVIDEFERNRPKVEDQMTSEVAQRFKLIRRDLIAYGPPDSNSLAVLDQLARDVPLVGAMQMQNFDVIHHLMLERSTRITPTADEYQRVVVRGVSKKAPLHRNRNSVADALLIELYATSLAAGTNSDVYAFVTTNSEDFSASNGDNREPHNDLADLFAAPNSTFRLGIEGLDQLLTDELGTELAELTTDDIGYRGQEPRRLDAILDAEQELFDKIWYERSVRRDKELVAEGKLDEVDEHRRKAQSARERIETAYGTANLGPYTDFDLGMLNGKLSALRWVVGEEWDFLDT